MSFIHPSIKTWDEKAFIIDTLVQIDSIDM